MQVLNREMYQQQISEPFHHLGTNFCVGCNHRQVIASWKGGPEAWTMPLAPKNPKIYHITHVDNLPAIIAAGELVSDEIMIEQGGPAAPVGMFTIKQRRLVLPVRCNKGDYVGQYVPFYFCARSVMLYLLHRGNHADLIYRGGQEPMVHLEADLHRVIEWANLNGRRWAFSLSNAGAGYTEFRSNLADLDEINWPAVANTNFSSVEVKEGKQAEFLLYRSFPWQLVERVGVYHMGTGEKATRAVSAGPHRPAIEIKRDWYF